ncbi:MAG: class I SAM-dependent methyltransferase [Anaerolineales bacterium]|nr:class I SAM-dependent methyltransferase [Anaerolineales bacterium]
MKKDYLNYDKIAQLYNQRYPVSQKWERGQALLDIAKRIKAESILEVGSGTGYWLNLLKPTTNQLYGLDYSMGMLTQAKGQAAPLKLIRGSATNLPLKQEAFDFIYCVDEIHHFGNHQAFIQEAYRLLKTNGVFAVIGHDPHDENSSNWYIYNYFDTVYDTDLRRYPSGASVLKMMKAEGFKNTSAEIVEHIQNIHVGEAVLKDPFLKHNATSQLALLSEKQYQDGIEKIKQTIGLAKDKKENVVFRSEINVKMFLGYKI